MACSPQNLKQEQGLYLPSCSDCGLLAQCWFPRAPLPLLLTRPAAPGTGEVCPITGYTDAEAPSSTCPTGIPGPCCLLHLRLCLLSAPQRTPGCPGEPPGPPDGETHSPRLRRCLSEAETLGPGTGTAQRPAQHHARLCSSLADSDTLCGSDSCSADALLQAPPAGQRPCGAISPELSSGSPQGTEESLSNHGSCHPTCGGSDSLLC